VSKPTKRLVASGTYDPAMARQRIAEWKAKEAAGSNQRPAASNQGGAAAQPSAARPLNPVAAAFPQQQPQVAAAPKSAAPIGAPAATADFDPEVGF
jgi:hypothetical protein